MKFHQNRAGFLFAVAIAASLGVWLAGCATSQPKVDQGFQTACFTLKSAHVGFQLFAAAKPGILTADDMEAEGYAYAGVLALCTPPYDVSNYQAVVTKILNVAEAITSRLSEVNRGL